MHAPVPRPIIPKNQRRLKRWVLIPIEVPPTISIVAAAINSRNAAIL